MEKVDKFYYLGDMLDADGGYESAVRGLKASKSDLIGRSFVNTYPF